MARAPDAIRAAADRIVASVPGAVLSGIVGDASHTWGYHCARDELPPDDPSVVLDLDRHGPGDAASALDISLPADQMVQCTARLIAAAVEANEAMRGCRELAGTLDGAATVAYDLAEGRYEYGWDDTHLWHIHISGYRAYADDSLAWDDIASVFIGSDEGQLMATEGQIRQWIAEEVTKAIRAEGVSGAGDAHHMREAGYLQMVADGVGSVVRSEGVSGAGDAVVMVDRYRSALGLGGSGKTAPDPDPAE